MLIEFLGNHVWAGIALWVFLYIGDYALTIIGAKQYQAGAKEYFHFERGYELNPLFQKDVAMFRYFSPRFALFLITTCILILVIWFLSRPYPPLFTFLMGALVLLQVSVHLRHLRNIFLFRLVVQRGGVQGRISYAAWFSYKVSSLELFSFAGFYVLIFLLTGSVFFLGGAVTCLFAGVKHLVFSRKILPQHPVAGQNELKDTEKSDPEIVGMRED
jgi:hypothetical protein